MVSITANLEGKAPEFTPAAFAALRQGANGPLRPYFRQAAAQYLAFIRRRFRDASRGNGTWPDLAPATKLARLRKRKGTRPAANRALRAAAEARRGGAGRRAALEAALAGHKFTILMDTGTLFNSLTEGAPGNVLDYSADGIVIGTRVRYGGHHQNPAVPGRPPRRAFLVDPDAATSARMEAILIGGVDSLLTPPEAAE